MQVQTERGLILVEAEYSSAEEARIAGYSYAFHSEKLRKDIYSKCTDSKGLCHTFALIVEGEMDKETTWIVKFQNMETGKTGEDKFTARNRGEAVYSFKECYRHAVYKILDVINTGKL